MIFSARIRFFAACAAIAVSTAAVAIPASAQQVGQSQTPSLDDQYVGVWEGTYKSDHAPPGAIKVQIDRGDDKKAKITSMSMAMGKGVSPIPVRDLVASSTDVSWTMDMMGAACQATAVIKEGELRGTAVCGHGSITFTLTKRAK